MVVITGYLFPRLASMRKEQGVHVTDASFVS